MAWSTIRKATDEDYEKLEKRAAAFIERHNLETSYLAEDYGSRVEWLEDTLTYDTRQGAYPEQARYLLGLWKRIVKRALDHPWAEGIGYGYVGFSVD